MQTGTTGAGPGKNGTKPETRDFIDAAYLEEKLDETRQQLTALENKHRDLEDVVKAGLLIGGAYLGWRWLRWVFGADKPRHIHYWDASAVHAMNELEDE
jgi:glucose-6-phosphate isomerase